MENNKYTEPNLRFATVGGGKNAQPLANEKDCSIDNVEKSVPSLRFSEFDGEWEKKKFSDVIIVNSGRDYKHLELGEVPVYGTGGYMLSVSDSLSSVDAIGIGRKGTIDKPQFLKAPFWTVDTLFFLTSRNKDDINFMFNLSQSVEWKKYDESTGVPSLSKNNIENIELLNPSLPEQQKIASYFTSLDQQIKAATKRVASLKQVKAACLQSMFPQEGETVPKVRFQGFEGEWKEVKADSVFKTVNERNRPDLPVLSATQDKGMVTREAIGYNIFHDSTNEATYKHIQPGQFVIHLRSFQGGFAHSSIEGICSPAYTILQFKDKESYDDLYWSFVLTSKAFIRRLELITYGIRDGRSISFQEFKEMYFYVPSFPEQQKIATFFTSLDKQIDLESQRLEKLKQVKKACLDKMFV